MANPTAPTEANGLATDFVTDTAGNPRFKLSVASNAIAGATAAGGYQGIATGAHLEGSFGFGSAVVVGAGVDSANVKRANTVDTDGVLATRERGHIGTVVSTEVSLTSNVRSALPATAATGRQRVVVQADTDNTVPVYVGSSAVVVANGISLTSNSQPLDLPLGSGALYGIAAGTAKVRVLEIA